MSFHLWLTRLIPSGQQRFFLKVLVQPYSTLNSVLPRPPNIHQLDTLESRTLARQWIQQLEQVQQPQLAIPKDWLDISYSRSSGPGGQNVNKVSTQAHVSARHSALQNLLAPYALRYLVAHSRFIVQSTSQEPSLRISSSAHRTQSDNLRECYRKLWDQVLIAAKADLAGETTAEQQSRVKRLQAKEKRKLVQVKKQRKEVKTGRRASKGSWD